MLIEDFLSKDKNNPIKESRVIRFQRLSKKVKSKEELRELEQQLLIPEKLAPYAGKVSEAKTIEDRIVEVVFGSEEDLNLFREFFSTTSKRSLKIKRSAYKIDLLITFLNALKNKEIKYNAKNKKLIYFTSIRKRNSKRIK